jgi:phage terminase small subunit
MEKIINAPNAGEDFKKFNQLKEKASHYIHDEVEDKKHEYTEAGNAPENFSYEHPSQAKFSALVNIFREKHDAYQKGRKKSRRKIWNTAKLLLKDLKIFIPIPNREPIFSNR